MTEADALPNMTMDASKPHDRRLIRTATVSLVAVALALPSASAGAAPPADSSPIEAAEAPDPPPAAALSRTLFEQGLSAYEAGDYAAAARSWTHAHHLMAQDSELSASRRVLGFDLAQAQMRAYAEDGDERRIAAARPLLERYVAWVDRPEHTMDEGEKQDRERAVELLARIQSESSPSPRPPAPQLVRPTPQPTPPPPQPKPKGTGLLIGGGLALGGGVASVALAFTSLASGREAEGRYDAALQANDGEAIDAAERDGIRANVGVLTSVSAAVLLGAAGVTMLAIGSRRRKRHLSASAALTPSSAGASVSMRF